MPPEKVVDCRTYEARQPFAELTLAGGRKLRLDWTNSDHPERCLPPGTTIEKRLGEIGFRRDGGRFMSIGGGLLVAGAIDARREKHRQREARSRV